MPLHPSNSAACGDFYPLLNVKECKIQDAELSSLSVFWYADRSQIIHCDDRKGRGGGDAPRYLAHL